MADVNFHFDPICPWAWITSRWVTEVQQLRNYEVSWKFISLKMINESTDYSKMSPGHLEGHVFGLEVLRIASAARTTEGIRVLRACTPRLAPHCTPITAAKRQ